MSGLDPLLARAFHRAPAAAANEEISAQREQRGASGRDGLSYEVVLDPAADLATVAEKVLPKLVYFLDCRGLKLDATAGVFISVFVGETLYFVHASDFVAVVAPSSGLSLEGLVEKYGAASTEAPRGPAG